MTQKNLFYYKIELNKGYIPSDKLRVAGQPFETGYFNIILSEEIQNNWLKIISNENRKEELKKLFAIVNKNIKKFLKTRQQLNSNSKAFYLNFNRDGIDCFVSRWNWKD
jgi:uncharacterized ferritin-like protein (DUF455 family)